MHPSQQDGELVRTLGVFAAGAFVVTNMVGSGIFTVPAFVRVATGGALASFGVWIAAGALGLCGALCYAELATRMPGAGGEYRYLRHVFGPLLGFLSGWTSFVVGFSAAVAASALGAVAYVAPLVPGWSADASFAGTGVSQGAVAASMIVLSLTIVHAFGIRSSGRWQTLLAGLVLGSIGLFVVLGFAGGRGDLAGLTATAPAQSSWWVALLQVSYAYAGWNAAAYMAGEVSDPARNLPRALLGGTVFVMLVYLALNALFFYAIPEAQWQGEIAVGQRAAERLFGSTGSYAVSGIIALAMFGSVSAMTAVGPRIYFAMARDGLAPALMARLSPQGRVPVVAIVAQGILASALALTGAFETLLIYIGSSLLLFNGLTIGCLIRVRMRDGAPPLGVFRTPLYPLPAIIFLLMTVAAWGSGLMEAPVPTGAALLTLSLGGALYGVGRQRGWIRLRA